MDFLKRWLKEEFILFLWGWGIVLLIIIFSMIAVSLFPDIAINLIGLFVLLIIGFHVVVWFKVKNWYERGGVMSNPAYLWLTDENDSPIIGSCLMPTRTGSIELRAVNHHVGYLPIIIQESWREPVFIHRLKFKKSLTEQHLCYLGLFVKVEH